MGHDDLQAAGITRNVLGGDSRRKPNQPGLKPGPRDDRLNKLEEFRERVKAVVDAVNENPSADGEVAALAEIIEELQKVEPPPYTGE